MNRRLWIAVAVAVLTGTTYALFFRQSDEGLIRRQLAALATAVRVEEGPGNPVFRAVHLKDAFSRIFTRLVEMNVAELGSEPMRREDLVGATVAVEAPLQTASLDFTGVRVAIEDPPRFARVTGTATGLGVEGDGRRRVETRDFTMRFEKADGEWRIASVSTTPAR
jgi:hypothetical protein